MEQMQILIHCFTCRLDVFSFLTLTNSALVYVGRSPQSQWKLCLLTEGLRKENLSLLSISLFLPTEIPNLVWYKIKPNIHVGTEKARKKIYPLLNSGV